jgi:hypothetical protein
MANEVTTAAPRALDEFDGYTDDIVGADEQTSERAILGQHVRFTNEATWLLKDETQLIKKLVAANVRRAITDWSINNEPKTRFLAPGEPFPDVKALNEAVPKSLWREGPGGLQGPFQAQRLVYLVDPVGLDKYTYATSTIGGGIAVNELVDRILWLRRLRGNAVYPLVRLTSKPMRTKHGPRRRPHFEIVEWIALNPDGHMIPVDDPRQLPPQQPAEQPSQQPAQPTEAVAKPFNAAPLKTVTMPNYEEDLNDTIPY